LYALWAAPCALFLVFYFLLIAFVFKARREARAGYTTTGGMHPEVPQIDYETGKVLREVGEQLFTEHWSLLEKRRKQRLLSPTRERRVSWRVVGPILLVGGLAGWLALWRNARASSALQPWNGIWLAVLLAGFGLMTLAAWLRRRKSARTWDLMVQEDPDSEHFITFVYPTVKAQLTRLGWRLHKSAYLSVPAIGVSIGTSSVTFWEAGGESPTLTLVASDIASVTIAPVSDGFRNHRAIQIALTTHSRANLLELNLRDVRHRTLSPEEMDKVRRAFPVQTGAPSP
jgi:hypothetical protein